MYPVPLSLSPPNEMSRPALQEGPSGGGSVGRCVDLTKRHLDRTRVEPPLEQVDDKPDRSSRKDEPRRVDPRRGQKHQSGDRNDNCGGVDDRLARE